MGEVLTPTPAGWGDPRPKLDPYSGVLPRFITVVDTDALLSSIDNHCRTGRRPRLLRIGSAGTSFLYAADHVYGEVYRGFPTMARGTTSVEELRTCFEDHYLPLLHWVETEAPGIDDRRVALVTDTTDVPTARLASLLAPCLVLSEDKALRRPGFAPKEWRPAAGHGSGIADAVASQQAATMAVALPAVVTVGGGLQLGRAARLPWWASLGLMGLGSYALLRSPQRRESVAGWARPFVELIGETMAEAVALEAASARNLKPLMCEPLLPPTVKQQAAIVLARAGGPLLASEITSEIERHFADNVPLVADVRDVLAASPEFTKPERARWQLGRLSGPWRD